jgi:hypothetical protein
VKIFRYTNSDGDSIEVSIRVHRRIPLDRVEELIAGIRDIIRQATKEDQR